MNPAPRADFCYDDGMKDRTLARRVILFAAAYAFWAVAYFATSSWNAGRAWIVFDWDPVWFLPVVPAFVAVYLSAYLMPFFVLWTLRDVARFRRLMAVTIGVIAFCAACFVIWPATILRSDPGGGFWAGILAWLYRADQPTDLFPSLHVALAFLMAKAVGRERPAWHPAMLAWATLIALSTLLIRQHYLVDVIAGVVVAYAAWIAYRGPWKEARRELRTTPS